MPIESTIGSDRLGLGGMRPSEEVKFVPGVLHDRGGARLRLQIRPRRNLARLQNERATIESLQAFFAIGTHPHQLVLHPGLKFGNFGKTVGDLEPLELANDLGGLHVLVKVDDGHLAVIGRQASQRLVPVVYEGQICEVGADERKTWRNMSLQSLPQDSVVARHIHDAPQGLESGFGLLRYHFPGPLQARDH